MIRLDTVAAGAEAAGQILTGCCGVHTVAKALDLGSKTSFDRAVATFASALRRRAADPEREAVAEALKVLDVDWPSTTAAQRRGLINDALVAAGRATAVIPVRHEEVVIPHAREVVDTGRADVRRAGLTIGADFNSVDERIAAHLRDSHVLYVTDEYGRRIEAFGAAARNIVAEGVELGLGRADIAGRLQAAATKDLAARSSFYWEVVAAAFTTRGRSFAQVSGYAEAGVERFRIESVLDEATTNFCRSIHGTEFSVGAGLRAFADAERLTAPEEIKDAAPWVRETKNPDGTTEMWVKRGAERISVGTVVESAVGRADEVGKFKGLKPAPDLGSLGIGLPPYHGLCRTTTVPVL